MTVEPLSDIYLKIREKYTGIAPLIKEEKEKYFSGINEKMLKVIWAELKFNRRNLKTLDGKNIKIISQGQWNLQEGPDFVDAKISIDGEVLNGDVEIHLRSSEWTSHKHNEDTRYENVILHIFLIKNTHQHFMKTSSDKQINQLCLMNYIEPTAIPSDINDYPFVSTLMLGECGRKLSRLKYQFINMLINYAAEARVLIKSMEYTLSENPEQLFYEKIAESFGYTENKTQMRKIAQTIKFKSLKNLISDVTDLQALYFGISGLLPVPNKMYDEETNLLLEKFNKIWMTKFKSYHEQTLPADMWNFKKVRPLNFPQRRISAFAHFIFDVLKSSGFNNWLSGWVNKVKDLIIKNYISIEGFSVIPPEVDDYFCYRSKFGSTKFQVKKTLLGQQRALEIIVNVFIPYLAYLQRCGENHELKTFIAKLYNALPISNINRVSKTMAYRLFGPERFKNLFQRKEKFQQGLIQLFNDFCSMKMQCKYCNLPEVLDLSVSEL